MKGILFESRDRSRKRGHSPEKENFISFGKSKRQDPLSRTICY